MVNINVGVVGATGMVGEVFLSLLEERKFPVGELRLFASENSEGQTLQFQGQNIQLQTLKENCFDGLQLVFFSSGDPISKEWAPKAVSAGAFAVDNSAAFRMDPNTPLVVPEINSHLIPNKNKPSIIANPNCSTIQLVVALQPLAKKFGLNQVTVSSYQAVSGAGKAARDELIEQLAALLNNEDEVYVEQFPHPIAFNSIPQIGSFDDEGFSSEERKIMNETKKILDLPHLKVSAFTVRVPTINGHSESVWFTLNKSTTRDEILATLSAAEGIVVQDDPKNSEYPTVMTTSGTDPVFVGRVHKDLAQENGWIMWVVADNIRKGAALNGIQIAEKIFC
ncbi:MAG: aspartate-semialdehyde dehydrogenase [Bdellovibrionales bacterium]|nr:aspartate-semialdehyde dehydrogenase [Bdellovibrionales bacterium]